MPPDGRLAGRLSETGAFRDYSAGMLWCAKIHTAVWTRAYNSLFSKDSDQNGGRRAGGFGRGLSYSRSATPARSSRSSASVATIRSRLKSSISRPWTIS
jgi:hypothetical protein